MVGGSYVGGVAGFNDVNGSLDVHYTLIGGRIYAYGDCAGGGFGLNASTELLQQELTIKPGSVQGHYYVGGCIGANIVNLTADTSMDRFRADNVLGTITGDAFCGGLMGYQRTYGTGQIQTTAPSVRPWRAACRRRAIRTSVCFRDCRAMGMFRPFRAEMFRES